MNRALRVLTHPLPLTLLALAMVYALAGFTLVPWLIDRYAPRLVAERTGHTLAIGDVQANPFLFRLDLHDVGLRDPQGETVATAGRILADLQLSSLLGRAWTFKALRLERPALNVIVGKDGRVNLAALVPDDTQPEPEPPPSRQVPRLVVQDGALVDGAITFEDRTQPDAAITVAPINVAIDGLATVPDREGRYTVTAALPDGASIAWRGDASLQPLSSSGEVTLEGLRAKTVWPFVQQRLALPQPGAALSASGTYRIAYAPGKLTVHLEGGRLALSDVSVPLTAGAEPALTLGALSADGIRLDLAAREVGIARLAARDGRVAASVDAQGDLDWSQAAGAGTAASDADVAGATDPPAPPWRIRVDEAVMENVSARYADASRRIPLAFTGDLPRASATATATIGDAAPGIVVDRINATLTALAAQPADADDPLVRVDEVRLEQGRVDTKERRVGAETVAVTGGLATLERTPDGSIRLLQALDPADQGAVRRELRAAAETAEAEGRPWAYALNQARIDGFAIVLRDLAYDPPFEYAVDLARAAVGGVASDSKQRIRFQASAQARSGGTLEASGQVAQDFSLASGAARLDALALPPAQPVINRYARVALVSGALSGQLDFRYADEAGAPGTTVSGGLQVTGLRVNEEDSGDRLLSWKTLAARELRLSTAPPRLAIAEVRLDEPGAKVVISEDRKVNLAQLLREPAADGNGPRAGEEARSGDEQAAPFEVAVQRVALAGGTVDFADFSLVLPFSTTVRGFQGSVVGIGTDRKRRAEVNADGRIDDQGTARLSGSVRPFAPLEYTNLRAEFQNVAMPPLSPYSATFAGRKIASGRLWLDLHYRIEDTELLGENKVVLADFKLGERVDAPAALDLPLDLAIALLTDSKGRIDLAVPVRGDVDDPQFDYGKLIGEALGNLVQRVVSAPFRALGSLLGNGNEAAPQTIAFAPGSAALGPPQRERLAEIAKLLRERPQLQLVVPQSYEPGIDAAALRADAVRRELAERLGQDVSKGAAPGPVAYDDEDTQRALERMYEARSGAGAVEKFAQEYQRITGRKAERVNPALAVFGRASPDRQFYIALHERLVDTAKVPETAPRELATRRAESIRDYLVKEAGLDAAQVRIGELSQTTAQQGDVGAELELRALERG